MSGNQIGRPCQTAYDLCERERPRNFVILSIPHESRGWGTRRQFGEGGAASDGCEGRSWALEPYSARSVHADHKTQYEEGEGDDGYRVRGKGARSDVRSRLDGALSSP